MCGDTDPAFVSLANDVGFRGLTLGVQRVELLLQSFFRGLARVDGAAHGLGRRRSGCLGLVHRAPPDLATRKNKKPLQWEPVMTLATADNDLYTSPSKAKPLRSTWTWRVSPLYTRVRIVPGAGRRGSGIMGSGPAGASIRIVVVLGGWGTVTRKSASLANSAARWRARSGRSRSGKARTTR